MEEIYLVIGYIVFWGVILGVISGLLVVFYQRVLRVFFKSDLFLYHTGGSYETEFLRELYTELSHYKRVKEMILKFRLRNIKKSKR